MAPAPKSVEAYLSALPADRREALQAIRETILANLDPKFAEGIQYNMVGYFLPHSEYPAGYHCDPKQPLPFASIASQKNHMAIYLFCIYTTEGEPERFAEEWKATGKKLDMGKSCVRFKKLEDVPLKVLGKAIKRATARKFVKAYEDSLAGASGGRSASSKKKASKKKTAKKAAAKKQATKKTSKKKVAKKSTSRKKATKKAATKKTAAKKTAKKAAARSTKRVVKKATKKATKRTRRT